MRARCLVCDRPLPLGLQRHYCLEHSAYPQQLVRLIHGDEHAGGPGFVEREVAADCNGRVSVAPQFTQLGSFVEVADPAGRLPGGDSFTGPACCCFSAGSLSCSTCRLPISKPICSVV